MVFLKYEKSVKERKDIQVSIQEYILFLGHKKVRFIILFF